MQPNEHQPKRRRMTDTVRERAAGSFYRKIIVTMSMVIAILLIGLGALLVMNWGNLTHIVSRTVKFGFEDIGELATQTGYFTNVQVVEGDRDILGIVVPFTHKKNIYSYDGVIKAGINFSEVRVDVDREAKNIRVVMPGSVILSTEVDEESFKIYDETNNVFNRLKLTDINQSMVELKKEIQQTALQQGILKNADENAQMLLRGFIGNLYDLNEYALSFSTEEQNTEENGQ